MKLLIGIPAYNEGKVIGNVIRSLIKSALNRSNTDILVVDDGSTDSTFAVAEKQGVITLKHILNRGLGGALKTIISYAKYKDYDILVTFDADGQHDSSDIPKLIEPIIKGEKDVVIGSRWRLSKNVPLSRLMINKFANLITYLLFSFWTSDSQSGLRALNKKALSQINLHSDGMEVSSEFFREIFINKLRFQEVPVKVRYTSYSQAKGQKLSNAPNVFFHLFMRLLR